MSGCPSVTLKEVRHSCAKQNVTDVSEWKRMDPGTRYGDARLNWKLRNKLGAERPLFNATDDGGTLQLRLIDRFYRV